MKQLCMSFTHTDIAIDLQFLASAKRMNSCKVRKETNVPEDVFRTIREVLGAVEKYCIAPQEQLEECLISLIRGADGLLYFLGCPHAKVSQNCGETSLPPTVRNNSFSLPKVRSLAGGFTRRRQFKTMAPVRGPLLTERRPSKKLLSQLVKPITPQSLRSVEVSMAVNSLDKLRERTKAHMELSNFFQSLKSKDTKEGFLKHCVHSMYEGVSSDPKLTNFFPKNPQTIAHIETSISQVFLEGKHIGHLREIHKNLGITESDFAIYLKHFTESFEREGGDQRQVAMAVSFLTSFKDLIVTKRRITVREGGLIQDLS